MAVLCRRTRNAEGAVRVSKHAAGRRCHERRGADHRRAHAATRRLRRALRAARGRRLGGRPPVHELPGRRRRRRRRRLHRRVRRHRSGGSGPDVAFRAYLFTVVRRVALRRVERRAAASSRPTTSPCSRPRSRAGRPAEEPALAGLRAGRRRARVPLAARAVAGRALVHRGRGADARGDRAAPRADRQRRRRARLPRARGPAPGLPPAAPRRTRSTRGAVRVAGKLGAYVRGGLGTRETAQVEAHLEDCGTCRALVLELGDVNHGMRAVIAPLVLGLLGLGALGAALPVGGGLSRPAAAASVLRRRCGGAGAARGWRRRRPVGGTAGVGAAATGTVGCGRCRSGGWCGSGRRCRGVPGRDPARRRRDHRRRRRARGRGGRRVATLLGSPDDATRRHGDDRHRAPARAPRARAVGVSAEAVVDAPAHGHPDAGAHRPAARTTTRRCDEDDSAEPDGDVTADGSADSADPTTPPTRPIPSSRRIPPAPTPAVVSVDVPPGGLALEAGLGGQELAVGVRNNGGTAATDLVAEVTLPGRCRARRRRGRRLRRALRPGGSP